MYCLAWFAFSMHIHLHAHEFQWSFYKLMRLLLYHAQWDNLPLNQFCVSAVWSQLLLHSKMIIESNDIKITRNYWRDYYLHLKIPCISLSFKQVTVLYQEHEHGLISLRYVVSSKANKKWRAQYQLRNKLKALLWGFLKKVYTLRSRCSNHPVLRSFILCKYESVYN